MERISALVDGELTQSELVKLMPDIKQDGQLRDAWVTYHLIGDALRGQQCIMHNIDQRVAQQLAAEPTILAPRNRVASAWKRYALPSLAAAAAVATVTWISVATQQRASNIGPSAASPHHLVVMPAALVAPTQGGIADLSQTTTFNTAPPAVQLPTRPIDAYLLAHQEFSPSTAIQGLAPYVRMVANPAGQGR